MYRVTGVYRAIEGGCFDFEYYEKHMHMCMGPFGSGAKWFEIAKAGPGEENSVCMVVYSGAPQGPQ